MRGHLSGIELRARAAASALLLDAMGASNTAAAIREFAVEPEAGLCVLCGSTARTTYVSPVSSLDAGVPLAIDELCGPCNCGTRQIRVLDETNVAANTVAEALRAFARLVDYGTERFWRRGAA